MCTALDSSWYNGLGHENATVKIMSLTLFGQGVSLCLVNAISKMRELFSPQMLWTKMCISITMIKP